MRSPSTPAMPSGPSATFRDTSGEGRQANTISVPLAASRADRAATAPRAASGATAAAFTSNTATSRPAASRRSAIGAPICPTPMKPILLMAPLRLPLRPVRLRQRAVDRVDGDRHAVLPLHDQDRRIHPPALLVELHPAGERCGSRPLLEVQLAD